MNKFEYSAYDSSNTDCAFLDSSYSGPTNEEDARKQLSYPLKQVKDYINDTVTTDTANNALKLRVASNRTVSFTSNGTSWSALNYATAPQGVPAGGDANNMLVKGSSSDYDTQWMNPLDICAPAEAGIPTGGSANNMLVKSSSNDYDTEWMNPLDICAPAEAGIPTGGNTNEVLVKTASSDYAVGWRSFVDLLYPVGALFITTASTDPASVFGGTWEQITSDAYLKIVSTNAGQLGGTSSGHRIPIESMPQHNHGLSSIDSTSMKEGNSIIFPNVALVQGAISPTNYTDNEGGGQAYYPYYLGVYVWRRTA